MENKHITHRKVIYAHLPTFHKLGVAASSLHLFVPCRYLFRLMCFCTTPCWAHIIPVRSKHISFFCLKHVDATEITRCITVLFLTLTKEIVCPFAIVVYIIKEYIAPHNHIYTYSQNAAMISKIFQACLCLHLICGYSCIVDLPRVALIYLT